MKSNVVKSILLLVFALAILVLPHIVEARDYAYSYGDDENVAHDFYQEDEHGIIDPVYLPEEIEAEGVQVIDPVYRVDSNGNFVRVFGYEVYVMSQNRDSIFVIDPVYILGGVELVTIIDPVYLKTDSGFFIQIIDPVYIVADSRGQVGIIDPVYDEQSLVEILVQ